MKTFKEFLRESEEKVTARLYTFEDGSRIKAVRYAKKGEDTRWRILYFDPNRAVATEYKTREFEGRGYAWIDMDDFADKHSSLSGDYTVKRTTE